MKDYISKILELDAGDKLDEMIQFADSLEDIDYPICQLMRNKRYKSAYFLSKIKEKTLIAQATLFLARAIGGHIANQYEDELEGTADLARCVDRFNADQSSIFYREYAEPALQNILNTAILADDSIGIMRGLAIAKAGVPDFRYLFDLQAPNHPLDLAAIQAEGERRAKILHYPLPPKDQPKTHRKAVVAIRELIYPGETWSRPLDMGPRITAALQNYGWDTNFYGIQCTDLNKDFTSIFAHCVAHQADVLILDDHMIEADYAWKPRRALFDALRHALPGIKIVGVHFDAWALDQNALAVESQPLDLVWEVTSPSLPVWNRPEFFDSHGRNKVLHTQHPHAYPMPETIPPLSGEMVFSGGIKGYNWQRAFWSRLLLAEKLPVHQRLTAHANDGLPALESYHVFMNTLTQTGCSLNFSMRSDLTRIVTGRCFETIIAGSLLLQEDTPDMDYYFIAGKHYIPFTTFAELRSAIEFVQKKPEQAEEIRQNGIAFAREHYTDDKIIGYIEAALYYADTANP